MVNKSNKINWRNLNVSQFEIVCKAMIILDDNFCDRALLAIYSLQTDEEKYKRISVNNNDIGFTKVDANVLTKLALKLKARQKLTRSERTKVRAKIQKYWRQLLMLSQRKWTEQDIENQIKQRELETYEQMVINFDEIEKVSCGNNSMSCSYGICDRHEGSANPEFDMFDNVKYC